MRDVTELRKRDRLLLSKDATIREIHHRVKNNLQTISSLLRLQARRLTHPEAIAAVGDSVRRIRTIALVHEALSREPGDDVTFIEIVRPLLRLAEEGLQSIDRPVRFTLQGDGGRIPAAIATPLSVVLTELLQNAVDHGFPEGSDGRLGGRAARQRRRRAAAVRSSTTAAASTAGFRLEDATGLGLSIVRTLVTTELDGSISMRPLTAVDAARPASTSRPRAAPWSSWSCRRRRLTSRAVTVRVRLTRVEQSVDIVTSGDGRRACLAQLEPRGTLDAIDVTGSRASSTRRSARRWSC